MNRMMIIPVTVATGAALCVAALGATVTDLGPWYQALAKPDWNPPDVVFPMGWTVIYALITVAGIMHKVELTQQALAALGEVIRRYPDSRYAADARLKIDLVQDHLAGKEMEIGRFYQRSSNWLAASIRVREVVDKYQTTSHAPEALYRLTESYLALGIPAEAKKSAAVLGANYPGNEWYERAYKLMQKNAPSA